MLYSFKYKTIYKINFEFYLCWIIQQPDELHYAELSSISLSRNYNTNNANNCASTTAATGNFDIYTDTLGTNSTLPKKPPAYDYFNEPTVYAQIDHFKTMPTTVSIQSTSMTNSSSATTVTPANTVGYQMQLLPSQSAYHQQHDHAQAQQSNQHTDVGGQRSITCGGSNNGTGSGNGTLSNSNTITFSSIQSPSSSSTTSYQNNHNQHTTTSVKPFSREIVTIRTPLLYTQQESCV